MKLHRFNDEGIRRFGQFLDALSVDPALAIPTDLLTDAACAIPLEPEILDQPFSNRLEAARYLDGLLSGIAKSDFESDVGLWAWLSLFYFDQLCPADRRGHRKPEERARWILVVDSPRLTYRHLLAGGYRVYRAYRDNPERAMVLLHVPLHAITHFWYQLASRQEMVTNPAILEAATELYLGNCGTKAKRGATGEKTPGSVFRLAAVLKQFDPVWDLYSMKKEQILDLLPGEFDRFRSLPSHV